MTGYYRRYVRTRHTWYDTCIRVAKPFYLVPGTFFVHEDAQALQHFRVVRHFVPKNAGATGTSIENNSGSQQQCIIIFNAYNSSKQ